MLIDDLKNLLTRLLQAKQWKEYFSARGVNFNLDDNKELDRLLRDSQVEVNEVGFPSGKQQLVMPGDPGRSFLYHAFSMAVLKGLDDSLYPTIDELDLCENYIYSLVNKKKITDFKDLVIAIFSYQFRQSQYSPHGQYADLGYSRVGVARVGNEAPSYDGVTRTFDARPARGDRGFKVTPARYGAFLARSVKFDKSFSVLRGVDLDSEMTFLVPVHKLFSGTECLQDEKGEPLDINVQFFEHHVNEKLRRIHVQGVSNPGFIPPMPMFDINADPFIRHSGLIEVVPAGASVLIMPVENLIARTVTQEIAGRSELARFVVPPSFPGLADHRGNRYWSSLNIPAVGDFRAAPEYAHIRLKVKGVDVNGLGEHSNLNKIDRTAHDLSFEETLVAGHYEAAHFADSTCEGFVSIERISQLDVPIYPAYSLVSAIDFMPQVKQVDVMRFIEEKTAKSAIGKGDASVYFEQGSPNPLCDGRFNLNTETNVIESSGVVPNTALRRSPGGTSVFSHNVAVDYTATAIVGLQPDRDIAAANLGDGIDGATSWLPDSAANYFAPGWDVSLDSVDGMPVFAGYGLGSPFPEDAKLCAALNSFWPAAAPDSSRSYGPKVIVSNPAWIETQSTSVPLLDAEVGYHQNHQRVIAKEVEAHRGWDGDYGPCLVAGSEYVEGTDPYRADLTLSALFGHLGYSGLDNVTSKEYIQRMEAMFFCKTTFLSKAPFDGKPANKWLVAFEKVYDWKKWSSKVSPPLSSELKGSGYILQFVAVSGAALPSSDHLSRRRYKVKHKLDIHLGEGNQCFYRLDKAKIMHQH